MSFQWSFFSKETFKKEFINTMIKKHPWTLQDPESRIVTAICLQIISRKLNYLSKYLVVFLFVFFVFVYICLNFFKTKKLPILQVNKYHLSYCKHYWNSHQDLLGGFWKQHKLFSCCWSNKCRRYSCQTIVNMYKSSLPVSSQPVSVIWYLYIKRWIFNFKYFSLT